MIKSETMKMIVFSKDKEIVTTQDNNIRLTDWSHFKELTDYEIIVFDCVEISKNIDTKLLKECITEGRVFIIILNGDMQLTEVEHISDGLGSVGLRLAPTTFFQSIHPHIAHSLRKYLKQPDLKNISIIPVQVVEKYFKFGVTTISRYIDADMVKTIDNNRNVLQMSYNVKYPIDVIATCNNGRDIISFAIRNSRSVLIYLLHIKSNIKDALNSLYAIGKYYYENIDGIGKTVDTSLCKKIESDKYTLELKEESKQMLLNGKLMKYKRRSTKRYIGKWGEKHFNFLYALYEHPDGVSVLKVGGKKIFGRYAETYDESTMKDRLAIVLCEIREGFRSTGLLSEKEVKDLIGYRRDDKKYYLDISKIAIKGDRIGT